ncbi:MAG: PIN domain nuclease [Deltaproteobacteria bacterium]|nr:PIN domain nuclease [Deltaproteobacteria bacterium]MBW1796468.1 PIN domain nuclease [Deltaproteobacteria bacterium]
MNPLKKVAADANVILSAVIGKAALKVFTESPVEVVTTHLNLDEVQEYMPSLASKYTLEEKVLQTQLKLLPLEVFQREFYQDFLRQAEERIGRIDPDDIDLLALGLKLNIPIWTNDSDFQGLKIKTYTTAELLKALEI